MWVDTWMYAELYACHYAMICMWHAAGLTLPISVFVNIPIIMPSPLIGEDIKRWCCLTSVCLSHTSGTERPRKTKIGAGVVNVTRDSDTAFKVKGQGHQADLVACSSHYLYVRQHSLRHRPERAAACGLRGGGIVWRLPAYCLLVEPLMTMTWPRQYLAVDWSWRQLYRWWLQPSTRAS